MEVLVLPVLIVTGSTATIGCGCCSLPLPKATGHSQVKSCRATPRKGRRHRLRGDRFEREPSSGPPCSSGRGGRSPLFSISGLRPATCSGRKHRTEAVVPFRVTATWAHAGAVTEPVRNAVTQGACDVFVSDKASRSRMRTRTLKSGLTGLTGWQLLGPPPETAAAAADGWEAEGQGRSQQRTPPH